MSDQQRKRTSRATAGAGGSETTRGKSATHQRLIEAARTLLASNAGDALRVGDITKEAGVSHGTFYVYFDGVDQILELVAHELADDLEAKVLAASNGYVGAKATQMIAGSYLPLYRESARLASNLDRAASRAGGRHTASSILTQRLNRRIVAAIERDPDVHLADVEIVASALAGMVQQFAEKWFGDTVEAPSLNLMQASALLEVLIAGAMHGAVENPTPEIVSEQGGVDEWLGMPIHGSRNAIIFNNREISYSDLVQRVEAASRWIDDVGLRTGDRLALLLHNGIAPLELTLAAWRQGVDVVPLDVYWQTEELTKVLATSRPQAIAFDDETRAMVDSLPSDSLGRVARIAVGRVGRENRYEREIAERKGSSPPPSATRRGGTVWYTSGTTSDPKGVLRQESIQERRRHARFMMSLAHVDESSVLLLPGPIYHSAHFVLGLSTLSVGGTVVAMEHFDAEQTLLDLDRHRVTTVMLVPSMLRQILDLPESERDGIDLSALRCVIHAGAPCPIELKERALEYFGPVVYEWYATTEQGGTYITPQESLDHPGSVGRPWSAETEVQIFDDDGTLLSPDVVGYVGLRDPRRPPFHYEHAGDDVQPRFVDGFFLTGDVGWLDDDGYLYIADRRADRIVRDGAIVYPSEVEAVLNSQDGVADSAVVGMDDDEEGNERVVAFILPADDQFDLRKVQQSVRRRLAPYKCPSEWRIVDELPRSPSGKLSRRRLR